jgi:hypothetical protein
MCQEWREDFTAFLRDMGRCPPGDSLDRVDVDGPYAPGNSRWATAVEQANNTRANRVIERDGERLTVAEWERRLSVRPGTFNRRALAVWSDTAVLGIALRPKHLLTFTGRTDTLTAWARAYRIHANSLRKRLNKGWCVERVLTTPVR